MIRIAVLDHSAESRAKIIDCLSSFLSDAGSDLLLLPRINFKPVSPQELRFNSAPDLLIIGSEFVFKDLAEISKIRKAFPKCSLVAWLDKEQNNLSIIQQVAKQSVDDFLISDLTAEYFFRRLLMLVKKTARHNSGKLLLVEGGKGGVGVTTVAAALADLVVSSGGKVTLIDLDFETQDLSRFLQARPFINDNLRLLLDEERPVTDESVHQCLNSVWQDEGNLQCMSPVAETDDLYDSRSNISRILLSIVEILDNTNDLVIVDMGSVRASLQKLFYRIADKLVFIINDDPASLYASVDKLAKVRNLLGLDTQICVVENNLGFRGLGNKLLRKEFSRAARLEPKDWADEPISFCKIGQRWPGSGSTLFSQANRVTSKQIQYLGQSLNLLEIKNRKRILDTLLSYLKRKVRVAQEFTERKASTDFEVASLEYNLESRRRNEQDILIQGPNSNQKSLNLPLVSNSHLKISQLVSAPRSREVSVEIL